MFKVGQWLERWTARTSVFAGESHVLLLHQDARGGIFDAEWPKLALSPTFLPAWAIKGEAERRILLKDADVTGFHGLC